MTIRSLAGKRVCILGFGREGRAMAEALETDAPGCIITVADQSDAIDVPKNYAKQLGKDWLKDLTGFDVLIKSPGIPPQSEFKAVQNKLTSPTQIFLDSVKPSGAIVIGVTGSKGKSTTSALLHTILTTARKDSHLVGNIGEPAIRHLKDAKPGAVFVMEMSSYQLMDLTVSPEIAVVTSFFPEHLDYHGTLEAYLEAKKNIARHQSEKDVVFYCETFKEAKEIALVSKGRKIGFSPGDPGLKPDEVALKGAHNLGNIAGALATALYLGVDKKIALAAIRTFKGLPHRLETVAKTDGVEWVNDSISTTPETAVAALNALGENVSTIIVGGQDRGYDFSLLAKRLLSSKVKTVILLPDSGFVIAKEIERAGVPVLLVEAKDMPEAVRLAKEHTENGIVLLSPASPSYGHFKNFEDRGEQFRKCSLSS